jgi:competence protein ComEA
MSRLNKYWAPLVFLLIAIIVIGGIVTWSRYKPPQSIEISLPQSPQFQGEVYIGGGVANPGFYPLKQKDSLEALLQAAGIAANADITQIRIYVPSAGAEKEPQRIDINRAEAWLLEALPDIGEGLAQRIIDYRQKNGAFKNITEITNVPGIGQSTYERIKNLITVAE